MKDVLAGIHTDVPAGADDICVQHHVAGGIANDDTRLQKDVACSLNTQRGGGRIGVTFVDRKVAIQSNQHHRAAADQVRLRRRISLVSHRRIHAHPIGQHRNNVVHSNVC